MTDLKPANENPWYVLMTLYGEQEGDEPDPALHEKNGEAWRYWAAPAGSKREGLANLGYSLGPQGYPDAKTLEYETLYDAEMLRRNGTSFNIPAFPRPGTDKGPITMTGLKFSKLFCARGFVLPFDIDFSGSVF